MHYFGTDGIRGKANEFLTRELAIKVGKSLSLLECSDIVIGYDTRESNHMLADGIALGAKSVGKHIIDVGVIPTPGLCYISILKKCIGVMITASHNPYQDNGIKIFFNGFKIPDDKELEIENYLDSHDASITNNVFGEIKCDYSLKEQYQSFLERKLLNSSLKVGFDCANGATYEIANFFKKHLKEAFIVANQPNGQNINNGVGSTHIENISQIVKLNHLDIGFAFDGDGDRLLAVDELGVLHSGDELMYVIAKNLKEHNLLENDTCVLTIMSNLGIINSMEKMGIKVKTTSVGDRNVLLEMMKSHFVIGGENSGHIIQTLHLTTGDGMLAAISILNIMKETNKSLQELTKEIEIWPDKLVNLKVKDKHIANDIRIKSLVDEYKNKYGSKLQLVIRASGTENLLRVSCCAKEDTLVNHIIDRFVTLIKQIDEEVL